MHFSLKIEKIYHKLLLMFFICSQFLSLVILLVGVYKKCLVDSIPQFFGGGDRQFFTFQIIIICKFHFFSFAFSCSVLLQCRCYQFKCDPILIFRWFPLLPTIEILHFACFRSSQFALRSYLYINFHELVGRPASLWFAEDKVRK